MRENVTIRGILESLPPTVAEELRREAERTGRGIEELIREGILETAHRILRPPRPASVSGASVPRELSTVGLPAVPPPNLGDSGNRRMQG